MWGSIFDATKELAEKARKAAEELERNLNDSAGITQQQQQQQPHQPHNTKVTTTPAAATTTGTGISDSNTNNDQFDNEASHRAVNDSYHADDNHSNVNNNDADDALNCDAWDDDMDDIDIQNDKDDSPQLVEVEVEIEEEKGGEMMSRMNDDTDRIVATDPEDDDPENQQDATTTTTSTVASAIIKDDPISTSNITTVLDDSNQIIDTKPIHVMIDDPVANIDDEVNENDDTILLPVPPRITDEHVNQIQLDQKDKYQDDDHDEEIIEEQEEEQKIEEQEKVELKEAVRNDNTDTLIHPNEENITTTTMPPPTATSSSLTFDLIANPPTAPGIGLITSFFGGGTTGNRNTTTSTTSTSTTNEGDHHHLDIPTNTTTPTTSDTTTVITTKDEVKDPNPLRDETGDEVAEEQLTPVLQQQEEGEADGTDDSDENNNDTSESLLSSQEVARSAVDHSHAVDDNISRDDTQSLRCDESVPKLEIQKKNMVMENPPYSTSNSDMEHDFTNETTSNVPIIVSHDLGNSGDSDIQNRDTTNCINTKPPVPDPWLEDDDNNNLISTIERILSHAGSRKILEERYHLVVARDDSQDEEDTEMNGTKISIAAQLQEELHQREQQLFSKTEQITTMEAMYENEKQDLLSKIQSTKEEAKRRIQKAKERVDAVELKLKNITSQQNSSSAVQEERMQQQSVLITELRKEGEKLAQKQADMELVVRTSKTETRELRKQIADLEEETNTLTEKLHVLEGDYKAVQGELSSARQGISQVDHLDSELRTVREENEKRASTILTLEQAMKELKAANKEMENELKVTRKGAAIETEQERKRLIMEHNQVVSDMETKLQATEREAAIREDALRIEIDDIRKRWQESVRRADTLSVDIQANTAPLLRQIDSINKQSRIRATAWAELETQLRNEIENSIVINEKITKECNEWKTKFGRLDRTYKEYECEVKQLKAELLEQHDALHTLQSHYDAAIHEMSLLKASLSDMERLSNESVARVRSEMTRKMVDSEEQFRVQIETHEQQLQEERILRSKVEMQLMEQQSYKNHNDALYGNDIDGSSMVVQQPVFKDDAESQQRLRQSQDQADILVGALGGLVGSEYNDDDKDAVHENETGTPTNNVPMNSYAALEELTSRLKASKMELSTLRTRLVESEKVRNELLVMVDDARVAREQLPLVEQRVQELTMENNNLQSEIQGLKDDIADVRELYRNQLNVLLEAQALSDRKTTRIEEEQIDIAS